MSSSDVFNTIHDGNLKKFKQIINEPNFDPNVKDQYGVTVLMWAIREGREYVQLLLDKGADPNIRDTIGDTALIRAVRVYYYMKNIIDKITPLLENSKTDINAQDQGGNTALVYACIFNTELAKLLLKHGADPHIMNKVGKNLILTNDDNVFEILKPFLDIPLEEKIFNLNLEPQDIITIDMIKKTISKERSSLFLDYFKRLNLEITAKQTKLFSIKLYENTFTILNNYKDILNKILEYEKKKPGFETLQKDENGLVIKFSLNSDSSAEEPKYIIKITPAKTFSGKLDNFNEYINEAFIGLIGELNNLDIPNFAKVYGLTTASRCPNIVRFKDKDCIFVIYEYIPGKTLHLWYLEYLKLDSLRINDFKNILLQMFYALYEAYIKLGFTHYDLHSLNILITPIDKPIRVNYLAGVLILDKFKATFIDYGSSHINYGGKDYGRTYVGGIRNITWWVHDIFKILMILYTTVASLPVYSRNLLESLLNFFTDDLKDIVSLPEANYEHTLLDNNWFGIEPFNFTKTFEDFLEHARPLLI